MNLKISWLKKSWEKIITFFNVEKSINVTKNQSIAERWNDSTRREKSTLNEDGRDLSAIPISQESCVSQKILQGFNLF